MHGLRPFALALLLLVPATGAQAGLALRTAGGDTVSVDWKDADLTEAVLLLGSIAHLNVIVDPAAKGRTITLALHDVTWQEAISAACTVHGFASELDGNVLRIAPMAVLLREAQQRAQLAEARAAAGPLRTVAFPLSWTSAAAAEAIVRRQLSPRGSTMIDARTNTLFVTDVAGSTALEGGFREMGLPDQDPAPVFTLSLFGRLPARVTRVHAMSEPVATGAVPSASWRLRLDEGPATAIPGAGGLRVELVPDGSRELLVVRSGRAGAAAPSEGSQSFRLGGLGEEAVLVVTRDAAAD